MGSDHTYLTHLECSRCGQHYTSNLIQTYCQICNSPLLAMYDVEKAKRELDRDRFAQQPRGMWRWHALLPIRDERNQVALGEGDTPLLKLESAITGHRARVYVKDESANPTGTFKARGLAAAISKAKELGVQRVIIPTAGNAGGALAAYAARGSLRASIFMPDDSPRANIEECRIMGAEVHLVPGLISDAARLAARKAAEENWYDVSTFKEPYRTEGKKIMGYELAETLGWELPDVIIYPTGGGTGLVGMWKAFAEMQALGWLETTRLPRMVSVQATGCAPVVSAYQQGAEICEFWQNANTIAAGLRVPKSFADRLILADIRSSQGTAVAVSDDAILTAQRRLAATEGIFAAPEGAATLAAFEQLSQAGWIQPGERVVLFNTGSGLKYL